MCNSVNTNIININFDREYDKLLFNNINKNETTLDSPKFLHQNSLVNFDETNIINIDFDREYDKLLFNNINKIRLRILMKLILII
jgi:hypothetical protein